MTKMSKQPSCKDCGNPATYIAGELPAGPFDMLFYFCDEHIKTWHGWKVKLDRSDTALTLKQKVELESKDIYICDECDVVNHYEQSTSSWLYKCKKCGCTRFRIVPARDLEKLKLIMNF